MFFLFSSLLRAAKEAKKAKQAAKKPAAPSAKVRSSQHLEESSWIPYCIIVMLTKFKRFDSRPGNIIVFTPQSSLD